MNKKIVMISLLFLVVLLIGIIIGINNRLRQIEVKNKELQKRLAVYNEKQDFEKVAIKIILFYRKKINDIKLHNIVSSIEMASEKFGVDKYMILKVCAIESNFYEKAKSRAGAKGIMQLMDDTFKWVADKNGLEASNIYDISDNILVGSCYLKMLLDRFDDDFEKALGFYNAGKHYKKYYKRYLRKLNKVDKLIKNGV